MGVGSLTSHLIAPFRNGGGLSKTLLSIFILLNSLILANSCLHDPTVGYDAVSHLQYIAALAKFHLPGPTETYEFFSPPLPYVFPAFLMWSGLAELWWAAKSAQLLNAALSVGLTFYLLKICDLIKPDSCHLKVASLLLLAMLPVYYKTFAFIRGEPFVAFFAILVVYHSLRIFAHGVQSRGDSVRLGVALGLLGLSRQWGLLLFPPLILWGGMLVLKEKQRRGQLLQALLTAFAISFSVGAWFYLTLLHNYGSAMVFNRAPQPKFTFSNHPSEFYLGLSADKLFSDPSILS